MFAYIKLFILFQTDPLPARHSTSRPLNRQVKFKRFVSNQIEISIKGFKRLNQTFHFTLWLIAASL